jgi:error-prone DNA polymerase
MSAYAELAASSNFSFLHGASHPQDLVLTALALGHSGLGIADRNSLAGVVRAYGALKDIREDGLLAPHRVRTGSGPGEHVYVEVPLAPYIDPERLRQRAQTFRFVAGARLVFADETPDILAYPQDRAGWGRLCRLLTLGKRRARKGECLLTLHDLLAHAEGLLLIVMPALNGTVRDLSTLPPVLERLAEAVPGAVWLACAMHRRGDDRRRLARLNQMAAAAQMPLMAVNDVLYDLPEQRDLQDIVTCIREGRTLENAGRLLEANGERHLKPATEMARLFADVPDALHQTQAFLDRITFTLDQLKYDYPDEPVPPGYSPQAWLEHLTWQRAALCYPRAIPAKVEQALRNELTLIAQLDYARYFLTIHDLVRTAEDKKILCQGRGSAANSAVCFVLGITCVDPAEHELLFARFLSAGRREPPDIDVDFEHERREEIIQYIYQRYGRHRAGIAATVIRYRSRSAIREVGKALGLTEDITARMAGTVWGGGGRGLRDEHMRQAGLDPDNPTLHRAIALASRLIGFPRHLSQHVGGFVLTRERLDELVPIGNAAMEDRTVIEWDKDDIDTLGLLKVDVLALGMLTCIRKAFDLLRAHKGLDLALADIPPDDPAVYAMLQKGDSVGVFQVESRAQISMLPRLKPRVFYDLVIQVAIVRPGPIQGDMVHPYLRRRSGQEAVNFPAPAPEHGPPDELRKVLIRTLGVPLFQEQAMSLAMVAACFTEIEANQLRRAMATFKNLGTIGRFEGMMVERMVARGYERDFAQRCFEQIKGFGSYGFPESHAASFAKLVYISSWIKCHHPEVFCCALLNAQPMGFYAPAQLVRDAREHGVEVRPVDVNFSAHDNSLEPVGAGRMPALRLGFRQVEGLARKETAALIEARSGGYSQVEGLARRAGLGSRPLRQLADADAFRSLGMDRRQALWAVRRVPSDDALPLFAAANARELGEEADVALPTMGLAEHVVADYQTLRLSLKAHPMALLRDRFTAEGILSCQGVSDSRDGKRVRVAGVVLVRQRPGNGKAIFITLEDETGITNVILWASQFEIFRLQVMGARLLLVEGQVQRSPENVVHLMASKVVDRSADLALLSEMDDLNPPFGPGDEGPNLANPPDMARHPRNVRILPKSRDFH